MPDPQGVLLIEIKNVRLAFASWKPSACQTRATPNAGVTTQFLPGRTRRDIGYCVQAAGLYHDVVQNLRSDQRRRNPIPGLLGTNFALGSADAHRLGRPGGSEMRELRRGEWIRGGM